MIKQHFRCVVRAPREQVFRVFVDIEKHPRIVPKIYQSRRVVSREGNHIICEDEGKAGNRTLRWRSKITLEPPAKFEEKYVEGDLKGWLRVSLTATAEGTELETKSETSFKGWLGILAPLMTMLAKERVQRRYEETFLAFGAAAERGG